MTVYAVQATGSDEAALIKARFVKEGFSKPAFVFAQFWLLYHRMWVPLAIWITLEVAFLLLVFPHVTGGVVALVDILARLFLGLEGNRLRLRQIAAVNDVVEARDLDEAEAIFFRRHVDQRQPDQVQA